MSDVVDNPRQRQERLASPPLRNFTSDFDLEVVKILQEANLHNDDFSDSARLQSKLTLIRDAVYDRAFSQQGRAGGLAQNVKVRLDTLLKLLGQVLCFPLMASILGVGKASSSIFESIDKALSPSRNNKKKTEDYNDCNNEEGEGGGGCGGGDNSGERERERGVVAEFRKDPVVSVLIDALHLGHGAEVAVMNTGSDAALDPDRAALVTQIMSIRSSPIIPWTVTIEDHYADVLRALSCHLLGVRALSREILEAVDTNARELRHEVADKVMGPRSKHESSSPSVLASVSNATLHFFAWLRTDEQALSRACHSAEIVASVDPSIRAWLKAEEYSSPADIIHTYLQKYRALLTHMRMPLQPFTNADVMQAFKDVKRESLLVNGQHVKGEEFIGSKEKGLQALLPPQLICSSSADADGESEGDGDGQDYDSLSQLLQVHVMLASSRTIAAGDSFCIVEDLFGGEGLVLCPCHSGAGAGAGDAKSAQQQQEGGGGVSTDPNPTTQPAPDLQIQVTAQEVSVVVREAFDLFGAEFIGRSTAPSGKDTPLISFRCATRTTIRLPLSHEDLSLRLHDCVERTISIKPC